MAEEKKKITLGNREIAVTQLEVTQRSGEQIAEYILEDESVIRVFNPVVVVYRMDDVWDAEGNAVYLVKIGTSVTTVKAPRQNRNLGT